MNVWRKGEVILLIFPGVSVLLAEVDTEVEEEDDASVEIGDVASRNPDGMVKFVDLNPDLLPESQWSLFRDENRAYLTSSTMGASVPKC